MFAGMELSTVITTYVGIGIVVTIVIAIINWTYVNEGTFDFDIRDAKVVTLGKFKFKPKVILKYLWVILLHLMTMFSIATIGGIADGGWARNFSPQNIVIEEMGGVLGWTLFVIGILLLIGLPMVLTYIVGFFVIGLQNYTRKISHVIFALTFLVSTVFWWNYIVDYNANIETTTEVTQQSNERELLMFYEIPVQQISGSVSGSSFIGTGSVSGTVFTTDTVPYVYINESGNGKWDSAPAADSEIVFLTEEGGVPKIVIVTYTEKTYEIDHNVDKKTETDTKSWYKYYFYLPKSVVQSFDTE